MVEANKTFLIKPELKQYDTLLKHWADELEQNKESIEHIVLQANSYGLEFCREFGKYLDKINHIKKADFHDIFVGRLKTEIIDCVSFICDPFIGKNLVELDLSDNAINPYGAIRLSKYILEASSLKVFYINNAGLGPAGTKTLADSLKGCPNLEVFALARNRAECPGATAVAENLQFVPKLRELYIFQDVIREEGMERLLTNLKQNKKLEILDIQDNFLNEKTSEILAELIKESPELHSLNLSDNSVGQEGTQLIFDSLEGRNLKRFSYNYNEADEDQTKQLLKIIKGSNQFQWLDYKGNDIEEETQDHIKEEIEKIENAFVAPFDDDDEDEETEEQKLQRQFANLSI